VSYNSSRPGGVLIGSDQVPAVHDAAPAVKAAITGAIDTAGAIPGASKPPLGRSTSPRMRFGAPENGAEATAVTAWSRTHGADTDPKAPNSAAITRLRHSTTSPAVPSVASAG
jgi:hypothetical protein